MQCNNCQSTEFRQGSKSYTVICKRCGREQVNYAVLKKKEVTQ